MAYYGDLGQGLGNLLGSLGGIAGGLIKGKREKSEKEEQQKRQSAEDELLRKEGFSEGELAILKGLTPEKRAQEVLKVKQKGGGNSAYRQALSQITGISPQVPVQEGVPSQPEHPEIDFSQLSDKELDKLINIDLKKKSTESKDIASRQKTAAPIKKETIKLYKAGRATKDTLQQLEDISEKGDLNDPKYVAALRTVGLDNPVLMKTDSNVFEKVRNDFLTKLKDVFGGRITNNEIDLYLKGLPDLLQSKEGRKKVIKVMRAVNKGSSARYKALKEIEDQYGDKLPYNLETLIEEKASKKLDAISKELSDIHNVGPTEREIKVEQPKQQLGVGEKLTSLPRASDHPGLRIRGPQGKILESNGNEWIEVGQEGIR